MKRMTIDEIGELMIEFNSDEFTTEGAVLTKYFTYESFKRANENSIKVEFGRPYDPEGCLASGWISPGRDYPLLSIMWINEEDLSRAVRVKIGGDEGKYLWFDMLFEDLRDLPTCVGELSEWESNVSW